MELSKKLQEQINKLEDDINKLNGYTSNTLMFNINSLFKFKEVTVGYRTSCGKTDKTHKIFRIWLKCLKLLRSNGFDIKEQVLKVDNSYATNKGGFWNEIKYTL